MSASLGAPPTMVGSTFEEESSFSLVETPVNTITTQLTNPFRVSSTLSTMYCTFQSKSLIGDQSLNIFSPPSILKDTINSDLPLRDHSSMITHAPLTPPLTQPEPQLKYNPVVEPQIKQEVVSKVCTQID